MQRFEKYISLLVDIMCMKIANLIFAIGIALALIQSMPIVNAEIELNPITNTFYAGDNGVYEITFTNEGESQKIYNLRLAPADATRWTISPSNVVVDSQETRTINLTVSSRGIPESGSQVLALRIDPSGEERQNLNVPLRVMSQGQYLGYVPNVISQIDAESSLDPRNDLDVGVRVVNRNPRVFDNITVRTVILNEALNSIHSDSQDIELDSLEEKTVEFTFELDDFLRPGSYSIETQVRDNTFDTQLSSKREVLIIEPYVDIKTSSTTTTSWLRSVEKITAENNGNEETQYNLNTPISSFDRPFVSSNSSYNVAKENGTLLEWQMFLDPKESQTVELETNYRGLFIGIILAILIALSYFALRSPVIIKKVASTVDDGEGGYSVIKVTLSVLNRSGKSVNEVQILDYLPRIAEYQSPVDKVTLAPSKISKTAKKGTILKWDLETIEPSEERLLSYEMKSTLSIVGGVTLPKAIARFNDRRGNQTDTVSSSPRIK